MPIDTAPTTTTVTPLGLTFTVTMWELVAVCKLTAGTISVPAGSYTGTVAITASGGNNRNLTPITSVSFSQTLGSTGNLNIPACTFRQLRDLDRANITVTCTITVLKSGAPYLLSTPASGSVTLPPAAASWWSGGSPDVGADLQVSLGWWEDAGGSGLIPDWQSKPALQAAADAGLSTIRFGGPVPWQLLQPSSSAWFGLSQARMDAMMTTVNSLGLKVKWQAIYPHGGPLWAKDVAGGSDGAVGYTLWPGTGSIAYCDRTTQATLNQWAVDVFGRWGTNINKCSGGNEQNYVITSSQYATYAASVVLWDHMAYTAIKAASPTTPVGCCAIALGDVQWLNAYYTAGGAAGYTHDAIEMHAYPAYGDGTVWGDPARLWAGDQLDPTTNDWHWRNAAHPASACQAIHEVMRAHGEGSVPIWLTEFGMPTGQVNGKCVDPVTQADYLKIMLRQVSRLPYVTAAHIYNLIDGPGSVADPQQADSLLGRFGLLTDSMVKKPSWQVVHDTVASIKAGTL